MWISLCAKLMRFRGSWAPFLRRSKAQTPVNSTAVKVSSSFIISANSQGLSLHGSASSLHRHKAQPLHPLHRASHLSKILGFTRVGHIAQLSTILSLPPLPSLLKLWSSGAPNPSPFLVTVICPSFITQTRERSAQIIPYIYKPVPSLWTPSAFGGLPPLVQSALGNYLVDLGRSVNSDVRLLCG